jgi:hypothetical protein
MVDNFKPFAWQTAALQSAADRTAYGLFADPGTGKTYCALRIAQSWTPSAVVVCPLSVKKQWIREASRLGYKVAVFHYEQLRILRYFEQILEVLSESPTTLILDESHRIKSPSTQCTKAALRLASHAHRRLALTGTPTANSPADLYCQLKFLDPDKKMGSYREFQERYIVSLPPGHPLRRRIAGRPFLPAKNRDGSLKLQNLDELKQRVAEQGVTVQLSEVLELPERTFLRRECEMDTALKSTYTALHKNYTAEMLDQQVTADNAAVLVGRLLRLTSGYGHADFQVSLPNPKMAALLEEIDSYVAAGPTIVWSVWVDERRDTVTALKKAGHSVAVTPDEFLSGAAKILVASPNMFGTGLNLQLARYQLWLSRSWSLLQREQALARNYRAGQTEKTVVVDYVTANTIDERVLGALETKTDLLNEIMTKGVL